MKVKIKLLGKVRGWYIRHIFVGLGITVIVTLVIAGIMNSFYVNRNNLKSFSFHTPVMVHKIITKSPKSVPDMLSFEQMQKQSATMSSQIVFNGPRTQKKIALTFDADMTPGMKRNLVLGKVKSSYNKELIDELSQTNTKATLFLTGMWIETYPDITQQLAHNPLFELGSHSYSHPSFAGYCFGLPQVPKDQLIEEVALPERLLRQYTGTDTNLFRFPGGCYDNASIQLVHFANDIIVQWDVVGGDGFNYSTTNIVTNVLNTVQNGSIIVLHMNGAPTAPMTADAVKIIIPELKKRGYEFVKVSDMLPASQQPTPVALGQ